MAQVYEALSWMHYEEKKEEEDRSEVLDVLVAFKSVWPENRKAVFCH